MEFRTNLGVPIFQKSGSVSDTGLNSMNLDLQHLSTCIMKVLNIS
jgi:hypothetical protein